MSGESQSNVLELVLAREKVRNALDLATTERLIEALERARGDAGVRAIAVCFLHSFTNPAHEERVKAIAARCDALVVIGAPNSSNSMRLVEVAGNYG